MPAAVIPLPTPDVRDIPRMLRSLADDVEKGTYDNAHNLAWVIDTGNGKVEVGLMGAAGETGAVAHLLFALAQQRILTGLQEFAQ